MRKFSDIIGQKAIIEHLHNALRTGSVSHAYIISGDAGSGRRTIASIFAAALQCEDLQEEEYEPEEWKAAAAKARARGGKLAGAAEAAAAASGGKDSVAPAVRIRPRLLEPCGKCLSCIQAQSGNQPDLQIKPYSNARKIYIIPDAEKLTLQAQNALLKTLEEPPEYAVIILIANGVVSFLPTILSRCVVLQTRAVGEEQIARFLQREKGIPEDQALILARFAGGNPGQALLLTEDQEFLQMRDQTVELLAHMESADAVRISEFASDIDPSRRGDVLAFVLMWFRDVLLYFSTQNSENLIFQEDIQYIIGAAGMLGYERIGRILEEIDTASRRLQSNVSADSVFEIMFLKIRQQYRKRV